MLHALANAVEWIRGMILFYMADFDTCFTCNLDDGFHRDHAIAKFPERFGQMP